MGTLGHLVSLTAALFTMAAMASAWRGLRGEPRRATRPLPRGW